MSWRRFGLDLVVFRCTVGVAPDGQIGWIIGRFLDRIKDIVGGSGQDGFDWLGGV